jgi:hypothetical protein
MCGEQIAHNRFVLRVPSICAELFSGGEKISPSSIVGKITVNLCLDCGDTAKKMATKYETSPLPECNIDAANWMGREELAAMGRMGLYQSGRPAEPSPTEHAQDAAMVVTSHQRGDDNHIHDSEITQAYTVLRSLQQLGYIETNVI